jgi:hypothetical protein
MDTPSFAIGQYIDQNALNSAGSVLSQSTATGFSNLVGQGLINFDGVEFSATDMTVDIKFPTNFVAVFNSSTALGLSCAHGTTPGSDTQEYSVDLASYVPTTGSQTVYIYATYFALGMAPQVNPGPPIGHPDWSPNYRPTSSYTYYRDSFSVSAGTEIPEGSLELARTTLTAGQATGVALVYNFIVPASAFNTGFATSSQMSTANYAAQVADAGSTFFIETTGTTQTLPEPITMPGKTLFYITAYGISATLTTESGTFQGGVYSNDTSIVLASSSFVGVQSDGVNWRVITSSRPGLTAGGSFSAAATLSVANSGALIELAATTDVTTTLPTPVGNPGLTFFFLAIATAQTLVTPAGNFYGPSGSNEATQPIVDGPLYKVVSDGNNWVVSGNYAALNGSATEEFAASQIQTSSVQNPNTAEPLLLESDQYVAAVNNTDGSYVPVLCLPSTNANSAVTLGQMLRPMAAQAYAGGNDSSTSVTVSFTAPGPGVLLAWGSRNVAIANAAAGDYVALYINGAEVATDDTQTSTSHFGWQATGGGTVTAEYSGQYGYSFSLWVMLVYIPIISSAT